MGKILDLKCLPTFLWFFTGFLAAQEQTSIELKPLTKPDLSMMKAPIRKSLEAYQLQLMAVLNREDITREQAGQTFGAIGELYQAHNLMEAAVAAYQNGQLLQPEEKRYPYFLGIIYEGKNQYQEARTSFSQVLAIDDNDLFALARLGQVLLALNLPEEAMAKFDKALIIDDSEPFLLNGKGMALAALDRPAEAIPYFEKVLQLQSAATSVNYTLGLAWRKTGNKEKAREFIEKRGDGQVAFKDPYLSRLAQLVTLSTLQVVLSMAADMEQFSANDFMGYITTNLLGRQGLVEYFQDALDHMKFEQESFNPVEAARLHYVLGNLLGREEEYDDAMNQFSEAIKLAPDFPEPYLEKGFLLRRSGQNEDAVALYSRVLERFPNHSEALLGRAKAFRAVKLPDAAIRDLKKALEKEPNKITVRMELANLYSQQFKLDEGIAEFEKLFTLDLTDEQRVFCANGVGLLYQDKNDHAAAIPHYRLSLTLYPKQPGVRLNLATALAQVGQTDAALEEYGKVLAVQPKNGAAWLGKTACLVLAARYEQALSSLEKARQTLPDNGLVLHILTRMLAAVPNGALRDGPRASELARELIKTGQRPDYLETYAMALAESGEFAAAVRVQEKLVSLNHPWKTAEVQVRLQDNLRRYQNQQTCCETQDAAILLP